MSTIASFALICAAMAHGEHEKRMGANKTRRGTWYAALLVAPQV